MSSDNSLVKCWIYFLPKFKEKMLELPHLNNYTSIGDHGRPYSYEDDISDVDDIEVMEKWYKN